VRREHIRVDSFYLADSAQVVGGKLYVLGGGWNSLSLKGPKDGVGLISVTGRILVPVEDSDREIAFSIYLDYVSDPDIMLGGPRLRGVIRPKVPPTDEQPVETATPFAFDLFGLTFPWAGEYAFVISHEGEELARTRFQVNFRESS
jgi:hypothetical protein